MTYYLNTTRTLEGGFMIVKELISIVFDKVIIYKAINEDFENIYKGNAKDIPLNILEMNVKTVGAARKSVLDIQVFNT